MSNVYEALAVPTVINAVGPSTRLSGGIMRPEVAEAMAAASQHCVDIAHLQARASQVIAKYTGAEAGFLQCAACGGRKPTEAAPGDWAMAWSAGDVFWCSYNLRASQWERPLYEDAPRFRLLPWMDGQIRRANAHYRTRAGSNYLDRSP